LADKYEIGQLLQLKKKHPCGEDKWEIVRLGADVKLKCSGCGRMVFLEREELTRRTKKILGRSEEKDNG